MSKLQTKCEREKQVVTLMIQLYCKKSTAHKLCALNAPHFYSMRSAEANGVRLWSQRPSVPIAGFIVINLICEKKYARLCAFLGPL